MTVRIMGFCLLLVSAVYCSFQLIRNAKCRVSELSGLCAMLRHIRSNIDTLNRPLSQILRSYDGYGVALARYGENVRTNGLIYAADNSGLSIGGEGLNLLRTFSEKIGTGYREDALRLCAYTIEAMETILQREREEVGKRMKMYKTLPVMSALSIGLLLL